MCDGYEWNVVGSLTKLEKHIERIHSRPKKAEAAVEKKKKTGGYCNKCHKMIKGRIDVKI